MVTLQIFPPLKKHWMLRNLSARGWKHESLACFFCFQNLVIIQLWQCSLSKTKLDSKYFLYLCYTGRFSVLPGILSFSPWDLSQVRVSSCDVPIMVNGYLYKHPFKGRKKYIFFFLCSRYVISDTLTDLPPQSSTHVWKQINF